MIISKVIVLDSHLRMLLKKYHLKLKFMPMDRDGYLVHGVVFVRENLSDEQIEKVILHEIGHAKNDPQLWEIINISVQLILAVNMVQIISWFTKKSSNMLH